MSSDNIEIVEKYKWKLYFKPYSLRVLQIKLYSLKSNILNNEILKYNQFKPQLIKCNAIVFEV